MPLTRLMVTTLFSKGWRRDSNAVWLNSGSSPAVTEGDISGTQAPAAAYQASGWFNVESAGCRVGIRNWLDLDEETGESIRACK